MDGSGLKLVGGDADTDFDRGLEPPAPIPFKQYAAMFPRLSRRPRTHVELEGQPLPFRLPSSQQVDDFFDSFSRKIDELAKQLGLSPDGDDDTDRPRAA